MKDLFVEETSTNFDLDTFENYETLIKMKNMELERLFDFSEEILNAETEFDEPLNDNEKVRLEKIRQRESDLKDVIEALKFIYSGLKNYEADLKRRETVVKEEYNEIKAMEETMNKVDFKVPSEIFGF